MLTLDNAKTALRSAGIRVTPQRLMIVNALVGNRTHPTAEDIYARVRAQYPALSLATVYHTLAMLAQQGLVLELHGGKEGMRCDPNTAPHVHAYCEQCGSVFDVPLPKTPEWAIEHFDGFSVEKTEISLYGLCAKCHADRASA